MTSKALMAALHVITQLEQAGYEAVFVGGAVRDELLGRAFHDIDVATSALPEDVKRVFQKTIDVGIEHGTVLVLVDGEGIEVTTYRTETTYSDGRRPDDVLFVRELREDLQRRDFTMNALAKRANGDIIDYYNGQADLQQHVIRAVGEPAARFEEDALRMLRAIRFAAQLGFTIEPVTFNAIQQHAQKLTAISIERVQAEFDKMFVAPHVATGIHYLVESTLAAHLEGHFEAEQWRHVICDTTDIAWAYFAICSNMDATAIGKAYRLSNKQKHFIRDVQYLVAAPCWDVMDYFRYDIAVLQAANDVKKWRNVPALTAEAIVQAKQALPIQQKEELVVNGQHFMMWRDATRGPWLKEALAQLLEAVVRGDVPNDIEHIKEWYSREWNN